MQLPPEEGQGWGHSLAQHPGSGPGLGEGEEALTPLWFKPSLQLFKKAVGARLNPNLQRGLNTAQLTSPASTAAECLPVGAHKL